MVLPLALPLALRVVAPAARPQLPRLAGAAGAVLVQVGLVLLRPWPLALAVDHALDPRSTPWHLALLGDVGPVTVLAVAATATVLLTVFLGVLDMTLDRAAEGAAERIGASLRASLFERAVTRSLRWHDRTRVGELVSRTSTDVGRLQDAVVATTTTLVPDTVMLLGVLLLLTTIDPVLAAVGVAVVPVLAVLVVAQRRQVRSAEQHARADAGRLASATTDLLRNVRAVQAFGRYDRARSVYDSHNRAVLRSRLDAVEVAARWTPIGDVVLAVGTGAVLVVGGGQVRAGVLSVGELLVALSYLGTLYSPVRALARLSTVLAKASVGATRIHEVLDCREEVVERPDARPAPSATDSIRFERVTFGHDPDRPVFRDLDLEVRAGETVCVVGPSGSGKSTLTHLLLRLYDVDGGRVLLDGVDVRDCTLASLRNRFSYVPQDPWLLDATLAENIAFGDPSATLLNVVVAARMANAREFVGRLPHGYDTPLGEGGVRLSGGQRRRVALARAFVRRAPVLLLDEPTASLDDASAESVIAAIERAAGLQTTLIVTHDPRLAAVADRVVDLSAPSLEPAPPALVAGRR